MKRKNEDTSINTIHRLKNVILSAIGELDLRGTNNDITKAMSIVGVACDSAIKGQKIEFKQVYRKGLKQLQQR